MIYIVSNNIYIRKSVVNKYSIDLQYFVIYLFKTKEAIVNKLNTTKFKRYLTLLFKLVKTGILFAINKSCSQLPYDFKWLFQLTKLGRNY